MREGELEIPLSGGRSTAGVVRVEDTVRRPVRPNSALTRDLLSHLEKRGFDGAPRFLGIDSAGREVLSFVPGVVPSELGYFSDPQLRAAARLLRRFHDATLDFAPREGCEVVCHGDASPCNCVFVDGSPRALIDFDDVHPGSRLDDLGYAAWLWTDIGNDEVRASEQGRRVALFFESYGAGIEEAFRSIIAAQTALAQRAAVTSVREWADECRGWMERNVADFRRGALVRRTQECQPSGPSSS